MSSSERSGVAANLGWLLTDKLVRVLLTVVVGFWLARYLGPVRFGALSYAVALVALLLPVAELGLEMLIRRDFARSPADSADLARTALGLRAGGAFAALGLLFVALALGLVPAAEVDLVLIIAISLFNPALSVAEPWLQSRMESPRAMPLQWLILSLGAGVRIWSISAGAPLATFAWIMAVESIVVALALTLTGRRCGLRTGRFRGELARTLMREAWPLTLLGVVTVIYMRIDVVMLRRIHGEAEVGVYAAATRLVELTYMLPAALAVSLMPGLLRAKSDGPTAYLERFRQYLDVSAAAAYLIIVPVTLLAPLVIRLAYGDDYAASAEVLRIQIWAALFVFLSLARGQFLINAGLTRFYLAAAGAGAVANVALNLVLIPRWGGVGAAYATVGSYAVASWLSSYFHAEVRPVGQLQTRALFVPITGWRWLRKH